MSKDVVPKPSINQPFEWSRPQGSEGVLPSNVCKLHSKCVTLKAWEAFIDSIACQVLQNFSNYINE